MKRNKTAVIIAVIIFLLIVSDEFATMTGEIGFGEALLSFILLTALIYGAVYWIKKSKQPK